MASTQLRTTKKTGNKRFEDLIESTVQYMDKLAGRMRPNEHPMTSGMVYGEQAKYVSWQIPDKKFSSIELMQITDVQFGHVTTKYDRVIEYRDWVLAKPNRFMFWTGDNVDAWALWSPGRAFDQIADPQSQVYKFCEVWAPARHRILGYVGGNHERRAIPAFGDLGTLIATLLKIPYSNGRQIIDIYFGKHQPFQTMLWHGVGGARTKGTVAQILSRFMAHGNAHLYLMGHVHQPLVLPLWKEVADPARHRVQLRKSIGVVGSSFMETWNSYGEISGYGASDVLMGNARLENTGKWEVSLR
jgi:hypothetical protein